MTTPNGSPEWAASQGSPWATANESLRRTERGASFYLVVDKDLTTAPGSCADGATYIVAADGGAWSPGAAKDIAIAAGVNAANGWYFRSPEEGMFAWVQDENLLYYYNGSAWASYSAGAGLGDVVGPASSVDNHVAVFDSTTGKLLKDGGVALLANGANITPAAAPATTAVGYLGAPQNTQNGTYTTVMADAGKHLYHTSGSAHTWTIDSNANVAYPIGAILTFVNENGGGIVTLAITSDTLRWGSSTGSRSLAANGTATAMKVASTTWRLTGDGIT